MRHNGTCSWGSRIEDEGDQGLKKELLRDLIRLLCEAYRSWKGFAELMKTKNWTKESTTLNSSTTWVKKKKRKMSWRLTLYSQDLNFDNIPQHVTLSEAGCFICSKLPIKKWKQWKKTHSMYKWDKSVGKFPMTKKKQKGGKYKAASLKKKSNERGRNSSKKGKEDNRLEQRNQLWSRCLHAQEKSIREQSSKFFLHKQFQL